MVMASPNLVIPHSFKPAPDSPPPIPAELECCQNCRSFHVILDEANNRVPICRRYPPVLTIIAVPLPLPNGVLPRAGQPQPMTFQTPCIQPPANPLGYCDEFKFGPPPQTGAPGAMPKP